MAAELDFNTLPLPVLELIVNSFDIETLAAFCCLCREWYECLNAHESMWEKACKNFGLKQTKDNPHRYWKTWKEYALLVIKRLKAMRKSECFRASRYSIDMKAHGEVKAIYYYKDRLAVATRQRIDMWCTIAKRFLFHIVNSLGPKGRANVNLQSNVSVKFDDVHIMVEDTLNTIKRFGVSSLQGEGLYHAGRERLFSYDFESRCDIVVGKYGINIIHIWKISCGTPVKRLTFPPSGLDGRVKVVFIRSPSTNEKGLFYVVYLEMWSIFMWAVTFDDSTSEEGIEYRRYPTGFSMTLVLQNIIRIPRLLSHKSFVYYNEPSTSESSVINALDLNNLQTVRQIEMTGIYLKLMAVGEKYIACYSAEEYKSDETIDVFEKTTGALMATYKFPVGMKIPYYQKGEAFNIVLCGENFLDGLDLTNDRGLLLAYIEKEKVRFVEWDPRK